jgi:hypothetical protein
VLKIIYGETKIPTLTSQERLKGKTQPLGYATSMYPEVHDVHRESMWYAIYIIRDTCRSEPEVLIATETEPILKTTYSNFQFSGR